ncbi:MAG: leucyl aminopeptidase family protein, partial [Gammaproteobacteria bacterium]|nr:leucyl aminopeptidase family protein [Gammaproteobacteria bacterium]
MIDCFTQDTNTTPITCVTSAQYDQWLKQQDKLTQRWLKNTAYKAQPGQFSLIPNSDGDIHQVVLGVDNHDDMWNLAALPKTLPEGNYQVDTLNELQALAWGLGHYQFSRYRPNKNNERLAKLSFDSEVISAQIDAISLTRNMINTPASDMMPQDIAIAAKTLAQQYKATVDEIIGDDLLEHNYPTIHAVGRASIHPPRLIDMR